MGLGLGIILVWEATGEGFSTLWVTSPLVFVLVLPLPLPLFGLLTLLCLKSSESSLMTPL